MEIENDNYQLSLTNINNTTSNINTEQNIIHNIESDLEKIFELFANSTSNIITNSDLFSTENEKNIDLKSSELHKNRLEYENINLNKVCSLQEDINNDINKFKELFDNIDNSINTLNENPNYNKSEKELLDELKLTKEKQQEEMNLLNNLVKTAKETLNTLEINSKINNMFN